MKITGGKYNSLSIQTANFANIKPTLSKIRQAVFNTVAAHGEFATFCDLFAGSGIMTFEAISRGYDVYSVEIDRKSAKIISENAKKLKANINLFNTDAVNFLQKTSMCFDVFYIDPPYNSDLYNKTLFVISVKNLLTSDGVVILEKPIDKEVNTNGFNIVKEKKYGDKVVWYLSKQK